DPDVELVVIAHGPADLRLDRTVRRARVPHGRRHRARDGVPNAHAVYLDRRRGRAGPDLDVPAHRGGQGKGKPASPCLRWENTASAWPFYPRTPTTANTANSSWNKSSRKKARCSSAGAPSPRATR